MYANLMSPSAYGMNQSSYHFELLYYINPIKLYRIIIHFLKLVFVNYFLDWFRLVFISNLNLQMSLASVAGRHKYILMGHIVEFDPG